MQQENNKEIKLEHITLSHRQGASKAGENQKEGRRPSSYYRKVMQRRQRQKRNRLIGIGCLSVILLILIICIIIKLVQGRSEETGGTAADSSAAGTVSGLPEKLSEDDFRYPVSDDQKEVGTPQEKKEIAEYEGYAVRYPAVGNQAMDAAIAQRADDIITVFKARMQACQSDSPARMLLVADYESYQTKEALVSVKFDIHTELPQESLSGDTIETYTYQMTDGAEVSLSDVLKDGYLDFLSEKTREFARSQSGTFTESAVAASEANFKYYTWNEDGLTLYFPAGTLIEENQEVLSFTIPMEDLSSYLTMDLAGSSETEPPESQEAQAPVQPGADVDPTKPMVCLTFDDGPSVTNTPELLDILEENDARATFFVVGTSLQKEGAQEIVRRAQEMGCQIGNHTMDHKNFKEISDEEICQEIEGVNSILTSWGLEPTTIVRPPYGGWNNHVRDVVQYPMIRWNLDTLDWKTRDPSCTIYNVLQDPELAAVDGDIILMHDIHAETIEACRTIIPELKARGFQLVTIEEMYAAKGIPLETGKVYYNSGHIKTDFGS